MDGDDFLQKSNFLSLDDDFQESSFFALDDDFQESSDKQSSLLNDVQKSGDNQSIDDQSSDDQSSDNQSNDQSSDVQSCLSNDSSLAIEGLSSEISTIDLSQTKAGAKNQEEPNSKRRKIGHPLWNYFEQSSDRKYVYCNLCRNRYGKKTGISTIKRHFESHHKGEYKQYQSTLTFEQIEHYGVRDEKKVKRLNRILLRWIICDQQAFSVVDNKDFCALISALDPRFKLPTRQTISNHVTQIYEQERIQLCSFFRCFDHKVAITTDAWTACTNQAYFSVTLHWIDDNWCLQRILLDLIPLHERHTGIFLAENIWQQIEYFGLGTKILSITADNAANMDVCGRHLASMLESHYNNTTFRRIRCAAHVLNLAVTQGISVFSESVKKARVFASHICRSQPCFEELKKVFAMKGKPFLVPDLDVETRWNSMYLMLNKLYQI